MSGVYQLMATGRLAPYHPHHPARKYSRPPAATTSSSNNADAPSPLQDTEFSTAGLRLQSANFLAHGREPALTNKHTGFAGCLDYIWVTPSSLSVVEALCMPWENTGMAHVPEVPEAVPFPPIPNAVWPSDHLAVGATVQLMTNSN